MLQIVSYVYFQANDMKKKSVIDNERQYLEGIVVNLENIVELYPKDWIMRLHVGGIMNYEETAYMCNMICKIQQGTVTAF